MILNSAAMLIDPRGWPAKKGPQIDRSPERFLIRSKRLRLRPTRLVGQAYMAGMIRPEFAGTNGERCCLLPFEQLDFAERHENERRAGGAAIGALGVVEHSGERREFPAPLLVDLELASREVGEALSSAILSRPHGVRSHLSRD